MNTRTIFVMFLAFLALGLLAFFTFASGTGGFFRTPTPTMTDTPTPTNSATLTATQTSTLTFTPSMTATPTVTQTFTPTLTATNTLAPLWTPKKKRKEGGHNDGGSVTVAPPVLETPLIIVQLPLHGPQPIEGP